MDVLLRLIYVDVVAGAADVDAALKLHKKSKGVSREGGFNLRKFVTNMCHNFRGRSTSVVLIILVSRLMQSLLCGGVGMGPDASGSHWSQV